MVAKTNKTKQAEFKSRMRDTGFTQVTGWVHQDDKAEVRRYIGRLKKDRQQIMSLQAKVDALMLEHCPDDMEQEQLSAWEKHLASEVSF